MKRLVKPLLGLIAAIIWGIAFVFQSVSTEYIETFTFNFSRSIIASFFLGFLVLIINLISKKKNKEEVKEENKKKELKTLIIGGIVCGTFLTIASNLQQFGLEGAEAGKAGFITAIYTVLVPIFSIVLKKKVPFNVWISVVIAISGLYFLCMTEGFSSITKYDIVLFLCSIVFSFQILSIDHFAPHVNGIKLSFVQFVTATVESGICMLIFEKPDINLILECIYPILYVGIMSSGVAYTLQILAQKDSNPTVISIVLSLESVFSALAGAIILHEVLKTQEYIGCALVFIALILAQIPIKLKRNKKNV